MGTNPSVFQGRRVDGDATRHPVDSVTWDDAQRFIQRLNEREKTTAYRLPTEFEWEYAAPGGRSSRSDLGRDSRARVGTGRRDGDDAPRGDEEAKCLGPPRHAGQRLGVGQRLLQREDLCRSRPASARERRTCSRAAGSWPTSRTRSTPPTPPGRATGSTSASASCETFILRSLGRRGASGTIPAGREKRRFSVVFEWPIRTAPERLHVRSAGAARRATTPGRRHR